MRSPGAAPSYKLDEAARLIREQAQQRASVTFSSRCHREMDRDGLDWTDILSVLRSCRAIDLRLNGDEWQYLVVGGVDEEEVRGWVAIEDATEEAKFIRVRGVWKRTRGRP